MSSGYSGYRQKKANPATGVVKMRSFVLGWICGVRICGMQICTPFHWKGADLRNADLHALPLVHLRGGLTRTEWDQATAKQRAAAAVLLTGADLREAHLEEAE